MEEKMNSWKKWVNISVVLLGFVVLLGVGVGRSVDDVGEGNVSVASPLPLEVLERRVEFDERWEQLKSDPGFMEILERESNREFFRLEVAPVYVGHNIPPDLYQNVLHTISLLIFVKVLRKRLLFVLRARHWRSVKVMLWILLRKLLS
jgi:hypothetical protein